MISKLSVWTAILLWTWFVMVDIYHQLKVLLVKNDIDHVVLFTATDTWLEEGICVSFDWYFTDLRKIADIRKAI